LVTVFGKPLMLEHEAFSLAQPMDALLWMEKDCSIRPG
jgi:uncharacterized protein (DUF302 family)